ncbi:hypothetical protein SAMN04487936_104204 [Halobacillus dabanensis]|uniref:Uncharacterized protein n=1 Tax=Halobacillus dabanensis TaxID=240302 RepID=A0A1I3U8K7_HALDA|nr:hypothetical protein SAMN04487936_104204 [Halobacillus dabanensis]
MTGSRSKPGAPLSKNLDNREIANVMEQFDKIILECCTVISEYDRNMEE